MSRYVLHEPLGPGCECAQHRITVQRDLILQSCACCVQVLGLTPDDVIYETTSRCHHLRYSRAKARPIRAPEGYKFIALRSDTGTGKNKQIDVLLHTLLHGQFNPYHSEVERAELQTLQTRLGPSIQQHANLPYSLASGRGTGGCPGACVSAHKELRRATSIMERPRINCSGISPQE